MLFTLNYILTNLRKQKSWKSGLPEWETSHMQNGISGKNKFIESQNTGEVIHLINLFLFKPLIKSKILIWYKIHPPLLKEGRKHYAQDVIGSQKHANSS